MALHEREVIESGWRQGRECDVFRCTVCGEEFRWLFGVLDLNRDGFKRTPEWNAECPGHPSPEQAAKAARLAETLKSLIDEHGHGAVHFEFRRQKKRIAKEQAERLAAKETESIRDLHEERE